MEDDKIFLKWKTTSKKMQPKTIKNKRVVAPLRVTLLLLLISLISPDYPWLAPISPICLNWPVGCATVKLCSCAAVKLCNCATPPVWQNHLPLASQYCQSCMPILMMDNWLLQTTCSGGTFDLMSEEQISSFYTHECWLIIAGQMGWMGKSGALVRNKGYETSSHLHMYDDIIIHDEEWWPKELMRKQLVDVPDNHPLVYLWCHISSPKKGCTQWMTLSWVVAEPITHLPRIPSGTL